jgi:Uma2 family endonuclease
MNSVADRFEQTDRPRFHISVHQYQKMIEAGVLSKSDRVELIEGEMFEVAPIGARHAAISRRINALLSRSVGNLAVVDIGGPVKLGEFSEPQPDVMLLRPSDYNTQIPEASDVILLIEISDSTLASDRSSKLALYARHGIPEYWIVDLAGECVEVYRDPGSNAYSEKRIASGAEVVAPRAEPSVNITVRDIFS